MILTERLRPNDGWSHLSLKRALRSSCNGGGAHDSEARLQEWLAKYTDLLAGEQIDSDDPRRWLLVTREMRVPGEQDGAGRWSLDHLFLDQDAIPTLVEVKRSSNTQIRREVVGQMLDYAANGVAYWPVEGIQATFESRCNTENSDPEEVLTEFLGDEGRSSEFWQKVKTNLQAGRIRMIFIADHIPAELKRLVEFLNEQMDPAEVLAIEVKQYVNDNMKTLVPRVIGQTELARHKKASGATGRQPISEEEYLKEFDAMRTPREQEIARRLISWARDRGLQDNFLRGKHGFVFKPVLRRADQACQPLVVSGKGLVSFPMKFLKQRAPFNEANKREELRERIKDIQGLRITHAGMEGFPKFPILSLTEGHVLERFIETLDWMVQEIRQQPRTPLEESDDE
ncbi:MAG: hypothetical protein WD278_10320 [Pirellulales bacterium]